MGLLEENEKASASAVAQFTPSPILSISSLNHTPFGRGRTKLPPGRHWVCFCFIYICRFIDLILMF